MKADLPASDKTPGAGRPRDPRIDAAILQATADLLVEIGYADLTMAAVAERAGTTKSALYRRWPSKPELVHEAAFAVPPAPSTSPDAGVADGVQTMVCSARDTFTSPVVRAALPGLIGDMAGDPDLAVRVLGRFEGLFDSVRNWLAAAIARGQARAEVDPDRLLELIGGAALFALLMRPDTVLDDAWVAQTAALVIGGVAT